MKKPFSGWKEGAKFYVPVLVLGILLLLADALIGRAWYIPGIVTLLIGIGMMLFFRDFKREVIADEHEIVAPADGTVTHIGPFDESPHYDGAGNMVSIFLSVFDVHVNRAPYEGTIKDVVFIPGACHDARSPESRTHNMANALWLDTPRGPMTVVQITGLIARRIVCPAQKGDTLTKGEKFGMIRFGSRTELFMPANAEVLVKPGDKVHAGLTVVARFKDL